MFVFGANRHPKKSRILLLLAPAESSSFPFYCNARFALKIELALPLPTGPGRAARRLKAISHITSGEFMFH